MSRSRKKNPVHGITCATSEKWDKRKNNRKLRYRCKDAVRNFVDLMPLMREISNVWGMAKDGKHWYSKKRLKKYPEIMRK